MAYITHLLLLYTVVTFFLHFILEVAQTSRLQCSFDALSLKSTSRWFYRGRNRIINPHLCSVSKQLKSQTNAYSECAPQDMCDYITGSHTHIATDSSTNNTSRADHTHIATDSSASNTSRADHTHTHSYRQ